MTTPADQPAILLCPGQGAQQVGMGKAWFEQHELARATFQQANDILGISLSDVCFNGPEERLNRTDVAQAAIYTTSIACHRVLHAAGRIGPIGGTAGLSLGEFTALHLAGAFDFESGLRLVRQRGEFMQQAADALAPPAGAGSGMVALIGADEPQANLLCEETLAKGAPGEVLVPANFNCHGQIVVSGSLTACTRALEVATAIGIRATPIKVAGAFHSPLMQPAAARLAEALDQVRWSVPAVPVVSNVTARPHPFGQTPDAGAAIDAIKKSLVAQLTSPVRWEQSMVWMITHTPGRFIELAPNKVLGGLMRRIDKAVKVENHAEPS